MAVQFTLPPDTRAVGTGDPPGDMNAVIDTLTAMGAPFSVLNAAYGGGADPTGATYSDTAFSDCTTAASAAAMPVTIPAGTYKLSSTVNWKLPGLNVQGAGPQNTILKQYTNNIPIIAVAGEHQNIGGFTLQYNTTQTSGNTGAVAMTLGDNTVGSCFISRFHEITFLVSNTAIGVASTTVGGSTNCTYENLNINGYSYSAINCLAASGTGFAGATGNVWSNVYIHNNITGSDNNCTFRPVNFQGFSDNVFNQLNVEHGEVFDSHVLAFTLCGSTVINSLHIEHLELSGTPGNGVIAQFNSGTTIVNAMTMEFCTYSGTSYQPVVRFGAGPANVIINGFYEPASGTTVSTPSRPWADFNSIPNCSCQITGVSEAQVTAMEVNSAAGSMLSVGPRIPTLDYAPSAAIAETFPRERATTAVTPASGTLMVRAVSLSKGQAVTGAAFVTNSAVKTGGTHGWYVLLDYGLSVLAVTADQTDAATVWGAANTPYPLNFGAVYVAQYDGFYYLGVDVAESGGTMPSFAAQASPAGGLNGTLTPVLAGTSSTGQTTPPALAATMTAVTSAGADNLYGYVF